ncbi:biopolymer transporter ExbD [Chitinimonas arctica]|uniref:Biopolymer transporter ExbD n=1 Tax=Chitinimonas arctica TaxID=2594795 RepID=A0A516SAW7_9NEIS|nr:biopolymer transporter ExbD [Chitinimonas arctica]QDQ25208.1 biopolymer transporter ExbD [Chitinimonas arctica]
MNVGSGSDTGEPEVMAEMNTTPLIDVMLVLLIMLIITIPVQLHAVKLDMPAGTPPPKTTEPIVHRVDIDFDGTVYLDGTVLADQAALEAKFQEYAAIPDQPEVHIRPNKLAAYKSVAAVMAAAQRIGVTKIGMVGNEQFM